MKSIILIFLLFLSSCNDKIQSSLSLSDIGRSLAVAGSFEIPAFSSLTISIGDLNLDESLYSQIEVHSQPELGFLQQINSISVKYVHTINDPINLDTLTLKAQGIGVSDKIISINVSIIGNSNTPIAQDDLLSVAQTKSKIINVISNDIDPKNEALSVSAITVAPTLGIATIENNQIKYTAGEVIGSDELTYEIKNESGLRAQAKVIITVTEQSTGSGNALPMKVIFVASPGSTFAQNTYQEDADFLLQTLNDSQNSDGSQLNSYYITEVQRITDSLCGNMNIQSYQTCVTKLGENGVLTFVINEDIPGGVLGVAHGIDCVLTKTGSNCEFGGGTHSVVFAEYSSLKGLSGDCRAAPLGCTATHELGHHLGYFHLSGEQTNHYFYNRCNFTDVKYYRILGNPNYTQTVTDPEQVVWHIGPHAMRKGGGTPLRNGGFFLDGYKPHAEQMAECYNQVSNENLD